MTIRLPQLGGDPEAPFPDPESALREPDGLLAFGGDLNPRRLLNAYRHGIFPWYSPGQPILWWSPDPRAVFHTRPADGVHLSRRFRREIRRRRWQIRADTAFAEVLRACADSPRHGQHGTWITPEMQAAYLDLHRLGHAHSIEAWNGDALTGGLYGIALGQMFYAESMFSAESGGSKVALAALAAILHEWGWPLIDAQVESPHLLRMGARRYRRRDFLAISGPLAALRSRHGTWTDSIGHRDMDWLWAANEAHDAGG